MKKMRLAVYSTSRIVEEFLHFNANMPEWQPDSIYCRPQSRKKAEGWAEKYGFSAVFTDEAEFLSRREYDAVYIGTANHLHFAAARSALLAGHSVILEKPFTTSAAEARELFRIADENGGMLLEAITVPYMPGFHFLKENIGAIGDVRGVYCNFSARSSRYDDYLSHIWNTTFDPECFGGALNDMGIYNLHLIWGLLGRPISAEYRPSLGYNGVDTAGLALLDYGSYTAAAFAAKDSQSENGCMIQGTDGCLVLHGNINSLEGELYAVVRGQRTEGPKTDRQRMACEFAEFARILSEKDAVAEAAARKRTMQVMEMLDELHGHTRVISQS